MERKQRLLSIICSVVLLVGLLPTAAFAAVPCDDGCFVVDGITYLPISGTTNEVEVVNPGFHPVVGATVSTYTGTVTIPATVTHEETTYYVTRIGNDAFSRTTADPQVTSVTVEEGVKEIGESAFQGCSGLTTLSLPSTITTIGSGAFGQCTGLKCLEIPAGVTNGLVQALTGGSIGGYQTFYPYNFPYDETSGEGIKFAQGSSYEFVTETDGTNTANLLYNGTTLDGVLRTYTASNNEITGDELTSLTIREGTTEIGPSAMAALESLETVNMPTDGTLKTIGYGAFDGCAALTSIDLSSVETIGVMAFSGTALTSADLSSLKTFETITEEGDEYSMAFYGCESLTTVLFGDVDKIPAYAFSDPEDEAVLTFVMLGATPPEIGEDFYIENLTVIIPAGSEGAYKDSALSEYIQGEDETTKPGITFKLELDTSSASIKVGETVTLTADSIVPTGAFLVWESDNTAVATVVDGVVTGVSAGTANITASIQLNGITLVSASCTVTVTAAPVTPDKPSRPTVTTYPVSVPSDIEGGSLSASHRYASAGATVTITVKPDKGYELDSLSVRDKNGARVKLTDKGDGVYAFTMPAGGVSVRVSYRLSSCNGGRDCPSYRLTDVAYGDWYHEAVDYAVSHGLMSGTSTTAFSPDLATTRGMIVTILYRLDGEPSVSGRCPYDDVTSGSYYEDAITWAARHDIVTGYPDGTFRPDEAITREQLSAILYRYAAYHDYDVSGSGRLTSFPDSASVSSYAVDAMRWMVGEGLITGMGNGSLSPQGSATRAQVAAILMRFGTTIAD